LIRGFAPTWARVEVVVHRICSQGVRRVPESGHAAQKLQRSFKRRSLRKTRGKVIMKSREGLVRLHRFRVEEIRKRLQSLDGMRADLAKKMSDLETMVQEEQRRSVNSDLARLAFPTFARSIQARRENIQRTLSEVEKQASTVSEELQGAYRDLKKYEIAADGDVSRDRAEYARQVQVDLAEMAMERQALKA
jgi:flagellar protein FliJ